MPTHRFVYVLHSDQNATFLGVGTKMRAYDDEIRTWPRFLYLLTKFCHPVFNCSEVIVLTSKQANRQTNRDTTEKIHLTAIYASG